jgi:hypothetical protein
VNFDSPCCWRCMEKQVLARALDGRAMAQSTSQFCSSFWGPNTLGYTSKKLYVSPADVSKVTFEPVFTGAIIGLGGRRTRR